MNMDVDVFKMPFPTKIHHILESKEFECVEPCGADGFRVLNKKDFEQNVLRRFFKTERMSSFRRQLNMYGFTRVLQGPRKDAYTHKDFILGDCERIKNMKRTKSSKKKKTPQAPQVATASILVKRAEDGLPAIQSDDESDCSVASHSCGEEFILGSAGSANCSTHELLKLTHFTYKQRSYSEIKADDEKRRAAQWPSKNLGVPEVDHNVCSMSGGILPPPPPPPPPLVKTTSEGTINMELEGLDRQIKVEMCTKDSQISQVEDASHKIFEGLDVMKDDLKIISEDHDNQHELVLITPFGPLQRNNSLTMGLERVTSNKVLFCPDDVEQKTLHGTPTCLDHHDHPLTFFANDAEIATVPDVVDIPILQLPHSIATDLPTTELPTTGSPEITDVDDDVHLKVGTLNREISQGSWRELNKMLMSDAAPDIVSAAM